MAKKKKKKSVKQELYYNKFNKDKKWSTLKKKKENPMGSEFIYLIK